jgi:hypothetical protein
MIIPMKCKNNRIMRLSEKVVRRARFEIQGERGYLNKFLRKHSENLIAGIREAKSVF